MAASGFGWRRLRRRGLLTALETYRRLPPPARSFLVRRAAPTFTVGAVLVLRAPAGRVLLVRQRHTGAWALPGGLLGRDEPAEAALRRELREELRLPIAPARLGPPAANVDPGARRVDLVFCADASPEDLPQARGPEVLEARWFAAAELAELTEPTRQVLDLVGVLPAGAGSAQPPS